MTKIIAAFLRAMLRALGFLTRLPVTAKYYEADSDRGSDAGLYPLAGALIGCVGGAVFILFCWLDFSPLVASLLATAAIIIITGGLHEDGLSDVADAFFAPKAYDVQARLAIMKDSHIGVFGTLALILTVGLRVALLADLAERSDIMIAAFSLIMAEGVSRAGMVALWPSLPNVSPHSIARTIGSPRLCDSVVAVFIGLIFLFTLSFYATNFMLPVVTLLVLGIMLIMFRGLCRRKIAGLCGDVLGAAQQIGMVAILVACITVF